MTIRVWLCPPLFFAQRRQWVSFAINGLLYTFCLFSIAAGLRGLMTGVESAAGFSFGGLFWLFSLAHVADTRRREKAKARTEPPAGARKRILRWLAYVAVPVVLAYDTSILLEPSPSQTPEARAIEMARLESQLAIEQAIQYQRAQRRNPGNLADLNAGVSGAGIDETDPWGRPWIVSPAFKDTRTPPNPEDLWICSHGPAGAGPCPPEDIARYARPLQGSVGFSARFGPWPGSAGWGARLTRAVLSLGPLPWVLTVGYVVGYPVYVIGALGVRFVRRFRSGTSPQKLNPSRPVLRDLWVICLVSSILAAVWIPSLLPRARVSVAQADVRSLASAVAQYQAHMGSLPTALTDLTREVTNARGEKAGPFFSAIPSPPSGFTRYHYRVQADGTFTISSFGITSAGERYTVSVPERESRQQ